jgi:hypothetical protein
MNWYKGNLHCHSTESDGQLSPADVAEYYKEIGYDFLGIADHYKLTPPAMYEGSTGLSGIPTCEFGGPGREHVLGAWTNSAHAALPSEDFEENCPINIIFQAIIDKVHECGGIPILCHPLWFWTFDYEKIKDVSGYKHFELCNASPDCNSTPIPGFSPGDDLWDKLLSNGKRVFGIASDDAHQYKVPFSPSAPLGGRGFIVVKADSPNRNILRDAFVAGHFYASTGAEIEEYSLSDDSIKIKIKDFREHVVSFEFFGKNGKLLQHTHGQEAEYKFTGNEDYVRARISTTSGYWLWTQPIFLDSIEAEMKWINS